MTQEATKPVEQTQGEQAPAERTPAPWWPFRDLWNMQRVFDSLGATDLFARPFGVDRLRGEWFPSLDVRETDNAILVDVELPGLTAKDVDIEVTGETLTIKGEKRHESETKEENYYRAERSFGRFLRTVALPRGVDAGRAEAEFTNGVLHVKLPLKAAPEKRKIEVKG